MFVSGTLNLNRVCSSSADDQAGLNQELSRERVCSCQCSGSRCSGTGKTAAATDESGVMSRNRFVEQVKR